MLKYKIQIIYDGTFFSGWQIQPHSASIQGELEKALETLLREKRRVIGAGRTDAGVHALGQVAHFVTSDPLDCHRAVYSLNALLPHEIRISDMTLVPDDFHAQHSACGKEYHYHVWTEKVLPPFLSRYRYHFGRSFSLDLLREATDKVIGERDFASVANCGSKVQSTIRTLKRLSIVEQEGGLRFEFEGDGFLYKMVRNLVGLLLEVSMGRRTLEQIPNVLQAKDRKRAGAPAPAKGLFLVKVFYPSLLEQKVTKES